MKTKSDSDRQEVSRKIDKYWVPIIARTIELLDCFGSAAESLTLEEAPRNDGCIKVRCFPPLAKTRRTQDFLLRGPNQGRVCGFQ